MDMQSRNQYLKELLKEYLEKESKQAKSKLLDEAMKRTGLCRKHIIAKLGAESFTINPRKKRACFYDTNLTVALIQAWKIFDYPCGQRLAPLLRLEIDRLRKLGELSCSDKTAKLLKRISPASIDLKLRREKEILNLKHNRNPAVHPMLYKKIPIKLIDEWDRNKPGYCQLDYVMHCGSSTSGSFIHTLGLVDIYSGWWDSLAIMPRSQTQTHQALQTISSRLPFKLLEIHPDNDSGIINDLIFSWSKKNNIAFSRSRPNKKNHNAFIEQKNWTHVRKVFGYWRYDSHNELVIMNSLYNHYLRLYKNFFQPRIKLVSKERIGGHIKRKYDYPKTPYLRLMESSHIPTETKHKLKRLYDNLNPPLLLREIRKRLLQLRHLNKNKISYQNYENQNASSVRKYISHPFNQKLLSVR